MYSVIIDKRLDAPLYSSEDFVFTSKPQLLKFISDNIDDPDISFRLNKINIEDITEYDLDIATYYGGEVH